MLQTASVYPATLDILKRIMLNPAFQQFNLVGGTALALQLGHRISVDLDLFTHEDYDGTALIEELKPMGKLELIVDKPPFLQVLLDDLKIDLLKFPYDFVQDYKEVEEVRLVSMENIAIMKLLAIARRGAKKDFFDIYFLLQHYSLEEIIAFFEAKLPQIDLFHILKSLTYFDDAELEGDPIMLVPLTWKKVQKVITDKVNAYLK